MRLFAFIVLLLAGCAAHRPDAIALVDDWTGGTTVTVHEREIFRDRSAIVVVRPVILRRGALEGYGVWVNYRRTAPNGPRIEKITAFGRPLDYRRLDRLRTHCIDGCDAAEVGLICLSREAFEIAARTGLPIRIWGKRGRAEGVVPAEAFARVLEKDAGSG